MCVTPARACTCIGTLYTLRLCAANNTFVHARSPPTVRVCAATYDDGQTGRRPPTAIRRRPWAIRGRHVLIRRDRWRPPREIADNRARCRTWTSSTQPTTAGKSDWPVASISSNKNTAQVVELDFVNANDCVDGGKERVAIGNHLFQLWKTCGRCLSDMAGKPNLRANLNLSTLAFVSVVKSR